MTSPDIHLARVTPDDGSLRIWAAATSRDDAVGRVLDAIPEGWTARLLTQRLTPHEAAGLDMNMDEIRELRDTPTILAKLESGD